MRRFIQFPHLSRIYSAGFLMLFFLSLIVSNLWADPFAQQTTERMLQQAVLVSPMSSQAHQALAQYYAERNPTAAREEYTLAAERGGQATAPPVLGASETDVQSRYASQKRLWERIHQTIPDYRYALAQLAMLSWMLGEEKESAHYVESLVNQNPVDPLIPHLQKQMK